MEVRLPLGFYDVSLWLAVAAIILLVASELISSHYDQTGLIMEKEYLRRVALILGVIFLATVAFRIYEIIITL